MKELATKISNWIKDYADDSNRKALVLGVSGGVDSALVSTLCAMTGLPTHCVILPCYSRGKETDRGRRHITWLIDNYPNIFSDYIDLTRTFEEFRGEVYNSYENELAYANAKSRLRMIALYQVATCVGGLVVGTGNKVEDYNVFFYTKYGDGAVDIAPIADLTKTEVRQMCRELGVLPELSEAVPTDGLWSDGRTDESQLGASYEELEYIITFLEKYNDVLPRDTINYYLSSKQQDIVNNYLTPRQQEVLKIYYKWHNAGLHKSLPIPTFKRKKNDIS